MTDFAFFCENSLHPIDDFSRGAPASLFFIQCWTLSRPPLPIGVLGIVSSAWHRIFDASQATTVRAVARAAHIERGISIAVRGSISIGRSRPVSLFLCQHPHGRSDGQAKAATGSRKLPRTVSALRTLRLSLVAMRKCPGIRRLYSLCHQAAMGVAGNTKKETNHV
jgi:hypothetical protein